MSYRFEKTDAGYDLIIDGFEKGIGQNPYKGIGDMRNVDPTTVEGEVSVAMKPSPMITQGEITSVAFTVDDATDIFTYDGVVPLEVNTAIMVSNSGGALPTGMSANTPYYVKTVPSPTTFTLAATIGGATLNVSSAGSGTNSFSTINMGTPKFIRDTTIIPQEGYVGVSLFRWYVLLDSNGRCWMYDGAQAGSTNKWVYINNLVTETSTEGGNGLAIWKNWIFVFTSSTIRVISIVNNTLSTLSYLSFKDNWSTWQNIENGGNAAVSHYTHIGQDDAVYFCNGSAVGSFFEEAGEIFTPNTGRTVADGVTTDNDDEITSATMDFTQLDVGSAIEGDGIPAGTFIKSVTNSTTAILSNECTDSDTGITFTIPQSASFNNIALPLPGWELANCLAELGVNLLVGGVNNLIYPWDRVSTSYTYPIFLSEDFVSRMVTINTTTYIFCGRRGRVYKTNGTNADIYYKIPDYLTGTVNPTFVWSDANFSRNVLYFGFQVKDNAGTTIATMGGLWAIDVDTGGGWLLNKLSYDTYAGYASCVWSYRGNTITSTFTSSIGVFGNDTGYGMWVGWNDGTNGGIDKQTSTPYSAGESYIDADMIPVGTFLAKKTYQNIEFKLTTPLVAGESVALYYRTSINGTFTQVPLTAGGATGDISGYANVNFEQIQWLQVRAVLTSTASSPSYVRLKELRVR